MGVKDMNVDTPAPPDASFSFATPTEIVELPTKGRYYPEGHPLRGVEEVEIRFMTAKDEDILTSKTLLRKGIAIRRFLQSVLVNKSIKVDDLYVGDKNAILIASRITGYGEEYDINVTCPSCGVSEKSAFNLDTLEPYYGDNLDENMQVTENGTFLISLPVSKVNLEVRLMTSRDEDYLVALAENKRKKNLPETNLTDQLTRMMVSVNGDNSASSISKFINAMPAKDSRYLRQNYFKIVPDIDMTHDFTCTSCGFGQELGVPLTAEFFWPR
jgi:rubredoxin